MKRLVLAVSLVLATFVVNCYALDLDAPDVSTYIDIQKINNPKWGSYPFCTGNGNFVCKAVLGSSWYELEAEEEKSVVNPPNVEPCYSAGSGVTNDPTKSSSLKLTKLISVTCGKNKK